jgi:hypothetical protein
MHRFGVFFERNYFYTINRLKPRKSYFLQNLWGFRKIRDSVNIYSREGHGILRVFQLGLIICDIRTIKVNLEQNRVLFHTVPQQGLMINPKFVSIDLKFERNGKAGKKRDQKCGRKKRSLLCCHQIYRTDLFISSSQFSN